MKRNSSGSLSSYSIALSIRFAKATISCKLWYSGEIIILQWKSIWFSFATCTFFHNRALIALFEQKVKGSDSEGNDNSLNCFNNNLCQANNIIFIGNCSNNCIYGNDIFFKVPVNNLIGTLNHVQIETDEIGLSNETGKQTVLYDDKYYIDYLDKETLTH